MDLSIKAQKIMQRAILYAQQNSYEYVTPEIVLFMITQDKNFTDAFESLGGDVELLAKNLVKYIEKYQDKSSKQGPELSAGVTQLLHFAGQSAFNSSSKEICIRHFLHAMWNLDNSFAVYYIEKQDITEASLLAEMSDESDDVNASLMDKTSGNWLAYAPLMNHNLEGVNPLIGREEELERTIQVLCRKDKNNPIHIGEPGVGKTAITYGLVKRINDKKVPAALENAKVFALDLGGLLAGTQYRGDFEKRLKRVLTEIGKEENPIIYIDEIHNLSGAGAVGEGSFDASNLLKPYLSSGKIRFIGATTFEEYKKHFEKNKSLARRFQNIEINEPSKEETIKILSGLKSQYEKFHGVKFKKGVLEYLVEMTDKHVHERFFPDKAIDIMDEACVYRKLNPTDAKGNEVNTVDKDVVNLVLTKICRVPIETMNNEDLTGLSSLQERLGKQIFGQNEALGLVVNAVKFSKAGLVDEGRPLASLLFVGPTGVGKTQIAQSLAKELGMKLIRYDMSEYGEKHSVAKLIGSPAGYVGYEEGGLLTEEIRKNPSAVLLLDEIEKAHGDIYNILLQVMDYATLTDNQGRKADFKNVIIIMTSNAGANRLGKSGIGFQSEDYNADIIMEEVKKTFAPEFRNRLNKIVVFNSMDDDMASLVVDKKLDELKTQLQAKKINLKVDKAAKELIKETGISQEFGAREIDRVIRNEVKPIFVDEILFGKLKNGGNITLSAKSKSFVIKSQSKAKSKR